MFSVVIPMFLSGCFVFPDSVQEKIGDLLKPDPNTLPYNRVDVFNNSVTNRGHQTYCIISDRGGVEAGHVLTGDFGWVPQNTYFGNDGYDRVNNNVISIRFYDAVTNDYLGVCHYQINQQYQTLNVCQKKLNM